MLWWLRKRGAGRPAREQTFSQHIRRNGRVTGKMVTYAFAISNCTSRERAAGHAAKCVKLATDRPKVLGAFLES